MVCIEPVVDYQKRAREVLLNALRGRIWGLYFADDSDVGGCKCEPMVGGGLWGIYTESLVAELDSICADGSIHDMCNFIGIPILSIYMRLNDFFWFSNKISGF
jgi:hypothetical protein